MKNIIAHFNNEEKGETSTPLSNYYLIRVYKGSNPYSVITDLPFEEANEISQGLYPQRAPLYMEKRIRVDDWLREQAHNANVEIEKHNPVSFLLVKDPDASLKTVDPTDGIITIPLENVNLSNWSFTLDDSFVGAPDEVKGESGLKN